MSAGKWEIGDHLSDRNLRKNNEVNVVKVIRLTNHDTVTYRADEHVAYKRPTEPPFMSTEAIQKNRPVHTVAPTFLLETRLLEGETLCGPVFCSRCCSRYTRQTPM
jgi:hypothetical protein